MRYKAGIWDISNYSYILRSFSPLNLHLVISGNLLEKLLVLKNIIPLAKLFSPPANRNPSFCDLFSFVCFAFRSKIYLEGKLVKNTKRIAIITELLAMFALMLKKYSWIYYNILDDYNWTFSSSLCKTKEFYFCWLFCMSCCRSGFFFSFLITLRLFLWSSSWISLHKSHGF